MRRRKKHPHLQKLAWIISRVLDPTLIIPLVLISLVWVALVNGERIRFLLFLLSVDAILPGFVLFYFMKHNVISSGWDVKKREERIPLFFFIVLAHGISVLASYWLNIFPLSWYLFTFWILTVVYALITLYWKISVHVGVLSGVITYFVVELGSQFVWLYAFVFLMIWARVYGDYHKLSQAIAGGIVPAIVVPLMLWMLGV